jgi:hypothetical protein
MPIDDEISDNLNYRKARHRHAAFIEKFVKDQQKKREWICFSELAELYGREIGRSRGTNNCVVQSSPASLSAMVDPECAFFIRAALARK